MSRLQSTQQGWNTLFKKGERPIRCEARPFQVQDQPVQIQMWGLKVGQLCVARYHIDPCTCEGHYSIERDCDGKPLCLTCSANELVVQKPGDYLLIPSDDVVSLPLVNWRTIGTQWI